MGVQIRNQIIGLVRFSYPSENGFSKQFPTPEALQAFLYDPSRLERRFALFEMLTLPSLLAQRDSDFSCVFLLGEGFPAAALAHLRGLVKPLAGAVIVQLPSMPHYSATKKAFKSAIKPGATHVTTFRLDDDDAVDLGYIKRLRTTAARLVRLSGDDTPLVIGFNKGFFLETSCTGSEIYDVCERLPLGIGLAMVCRAGQTHNIFVRNHRFVSQFFNTYTDAVTPAFIRTVHRDNDSGTHITGQSRTMSDAEIDKALSENFATGLVKLKRV